MYKIGDELKFNTYLTIDFTKSSPNIMHNKLKKTLTNESINKSILRKYNNPTKGWRRLNDAIITRDNNVSTYSTITITDNTTHKGIYVGEIKRKLVRKYDRNATHSDELRMVSPYTRSTASHRIDNPAELESIALISVRKNKIIGVPMSNIIFFNSDIKVL